jgi:hypothetical protein
MLDVLIRDSCYMRFWILLVLIQISVHSNVKEAQYEILDYKRKDEARKRIHEMEWICRLNSTRNYLVPLIMWKTNICHKGD